MNFNFISNQKKIPYNTIIHIEFFKIFGFSFFKYFYLINRLGDFRLDKRTFIIYKDTNKLMWINFFLMNNFVYSTKLVLYKNGKKNKYMSFYNYKQNRVLNKLPIRGQRTQTNAKTCKKF